MKCDITYPNPRNKPPVKVEYSALKPGMLFKRELCQDLSLKLKEGHMSIGVSTPTYYPEWKSRDVEVFYIDGKIDILIYSTGVN